MKKKVEKTAKDDASAKDSAPQVSLTDRIRPFVLIFLLIGLPVILYHAFTQYMYVCRIPAGTKVVDSTMVPIQSPLADFMISSGSSKNGTAKSPAGPKWIAGLECFPLRGTEDYCCTYFMAVSSSSGA